MPATPAERTSQGLASAVLGGIRTIADLGRMVAAGASRIGTNCGAKIVAEFRAAHPRQ